MKNVKNKLIACTLAAVSAFSFSVSFKKFGPITASAAANEEFLSDVALVYEDSVEEAQAAIADTEWKLYKKDLNPNADYMFDDGVYLIYKTSTDVEDAITDLSVMQMDGGYNEGNYQEMIKKSREEYKKMSENYKAAIDYFVEAYDNDDFLAESAYCKGNCNYLYGILPCI